MISIRLKTAREISFFHQWRQSLSFSSGPKRSRARGKQGNGTENQSKNSERSRLTNVPSLKDFIHTQKVKKQFRGFLRAVALIPDERFRIQAKGEVRAAFQHSKNETDKLSIVMAVKEGERKLKDVQSMVGYQDVNKNNVKTSDETDSWLNIDDKEDPRGRVGVNWPWDNKDN